MNMLSVFTVLHTDLSDFKQTYSEFSSYTEYLSQIFFIDKNAMVLKKN